MPSRTASTTATTTTALEPSFPLFRTAASRTAIRYDDFIRTSDPIVALLNDYSAFLRRETRTERTIVASQNRWIIYLELAFIVLAPQTLWVTRNITFADHFHEPSAWLLLWGARLGSLWLWPWAVRQIWARIRALFKRQAWWPWALAASAALFYFEGNYRSDVIEGAVASVKVRSPWVYSPLRPLLMAILLVLVLMARCFWILPSIVRWMQSETAVRLRPFVIPIAFIIGLVLFLLYFWRAGRNAGATGEDDTPDFPGPPPPSHVNEICPWAPDILTHGPDDCPYTPPAMSECAATQETATSQEGPTTREEPTSGEEAANQEEIEDQNEDFRNRVTEIVQAREDATLHEAAMLQDDRARNIGEAQRNVETALKLLRDAGPDLDEDSRQRAESAYHSAHDAHQAAIFNGGLEDQVRHILHAVDNLALNVREIQRGSGVIIQGRATAPMRDEQPGGSDVAYDDQGGSEDSEMYGGPGDEENDNLSDGEGDPNKHATTLVEAEAFPVLRPRTRGERRNASRVGSPSEVSAPAAVQQPPAEETGSRASRRRRRNRVNRTTAEERVPEDEE